MPFYAYFESSETCPGASINEQFAVFGMLPVQSRVDRLVPLCPVLARGPRLLAKLIKLSATRNRRGNSVTQLVPINHYIIRELVLSTVCSTKIEERGHCVHSMSGLAATFIWYQTQERIPLDKMAAISQTIFSDAFSWLKVLCFDSNFTEVCS